MEVGKTVKIGREYYEAWKIEFEGGKMSIWWKLRVRENGHG